MGFVRKILYFPRWKKGTAPIEPKKQELKASRMVDMLDGAAHGLRRLAKTLHKTSQEIENSVQFDGASALDTFESENFTDGLEDFFKQSRKQAKVSSSLDQQTQDEENSIVPYFGSSQIAPSRDENLVEGQWSSTQENDKSTIDKSSEAMPSTPNTPESERDEFDVLNLKEARKELRAYRLLYQAAETKAIGELEESQEKHSAAMKELEDRIAKASCSKAHLQKELKKSMEGRKADAQTFKTTLEAEKQVWADKEAFFRVEREARLSEIESLKATFETEREAWARKETRPSEIESLKSTFELEREAWFSREAAYIAKQDMMQNDIMESITIASGLEAQKTRALAQYTVLQGQFYNLMKDHQETVAEFNEYRDEIRNASGLIQGLEGFVHPIARDANLRAYQKKMKTGLQIIKDGRHLLETYRKENTDLRSSLKGWMDALAKERANHEATKVRIGRYSEQNKGLQAMVRTMREALEGVGRVAKAGPSSESSE